MRYLLALSATLLGTTSFAQDACTKLTAPGARLQCYDNWAKSSLGAIIISDRIPEGLLPKASDTVEPSPTETAEAPPTVEPEPSTGKWVVQTETSAMTDTTNVYATLMSENTQTCRGYGGSAYMTLFVRCMENTTSLFFAADCHFASGYEGYGDVTYRIDSGKPTTRSFDASTNNGALGLWNGSSSIPVIKSLQGKERLVARMTPFSENAVEYTFDLTGAEEALAGVRKECGW